MNWKRNAAAALAALALGVGGAAAQQFRSAPDARPSAFPQYGIGGYTEADALAEQLIDGGLGGAGARPYRGEMLSQETYYPRPAYSTPAQSRYDAPGVPAARGLGSNPSLYDVYAANDGTSAGFGGCPGCGAGPGCGVDLAPLLHGAGCGCGAGGACPTCLGPEWIGSADLLFLKREDISRGLGVLVNNATGIPTIPNLDQLDFDYEPGVRAYLARSVFRCDIFAEVGYLGLHEWDAQRTFTSNDAFTLQRGAITNVLRGPIDQSIDYETDLDSFELNLKNDVLLNQSVFLLAGLRYVSIDENLRLLESGSALNSDGVLLPSVATANIDTDNDLIGPQFGIEAKRALSPNLGVGFMGKVGLMANFLDVNGQQAISNGPQGPLADSFGDDGSKFSFLADVGVHLSYALRQNLRLRAGYQILYLSDVAQAGDQFLPTAFGAAPVAGAPNGTAPDLEYREEVEDLVFHGPFVGLEAAWGCCR